MMVRGRRPSSFTIFHYLCVFLCTLTMVQSMQCPPCEKIHCNPKRAHKLKCRGGVTTGVCGCCPACAKQEGEGCGGDFSYKGKCDKGLYCEPAPQTNYLFVRNAPEGVCKEMPIHIKDQPVQIPSECRPKCTADYCRKHPRAICSAIDVVDIIQSCQGKCQHTSCKACRFVAPPRCRKCAPDDFRCMKKFGKCVKKDTCDRKIFPCASNKKLKEKNSSTAASIMAAVDDVTREREASSSV